MLELQREQGDQSMLSELTPNKPDKWWFNRDSLFLNHDKLGRNFGCKCNHPANNKTDANNNKPSEPLYNS